MIALIFSMSLLLLSSISIISTTTYSVLDNTFVSLNYCLPESWIVLDPEEKHQPMYDRTKVETSTIAHVKNNLKSQLNSVKLGFYYFDSKTLKELDDRYITGVRISLKADITTFRKYSKAMVYTIVKQD